MTSAPINDYPAMQVYRNTKSVDNGAASQTEELFGSFQNAMKQAKGGQTESVGETSGQAQTAGNVTRTADVFVSKGKNEKTAIQNTDTSEKTERSTAAKQTKKTETAVDEAAKETEKEVVQKVADELDVTEEEVEEAMAALGLTVMDLTDPANMAALVTQLTGENDPMALLTDENLFETIRQLTVDVGEIIEQNVQELSEVLGTDAEEALHMIQDFMEGTDQKDVETEVGVVIEVDHELPDEETGVIRDDAVSESDAAEEEEIAVSTEKETMPEQTADQKQSMMNFNQESSPLINQTFDTGTVAAGEVQQTEMPFTSYVDTADIINQIGEYVKIHQSEGLSEMEISLNPESLGNIHLQVASREGVITATITTQNDEVREALMVQAMVLKEELNEQGLKVEAVDVTVASHEFERDMQNGGEEAKNLFEQQVQKQTRRRIVIDGLKQAEEMLADENLTDAEKLQIDMMAKSGNSVDFTA